MVAILLVTHGEIGFQLLETARDILGELKSSVACLSVSSKCNLDHITGQAVNLMNEMNPQGGVLVMTDLYGSTPHNIAKHLQIEHKAIVSGLNLSMLLRTLNYSTKDLSLDELAEIAQQGGHVGIQYQCEAMAHAC